MYSNLAVLVPASDVCSAHARCVWIQMGWLWVWVAFRLRDCLRDRPRGGHRPRSVSKSQSLSSWPSHTHIKR